MQTLALLALVQERQSDWLAFGQILNLVQLVLVPWPGWLASVQLASVQRQNLAQL